MACADVVLGGKNGREPDEQLSLERPGLKVVYMSGYTDDIIAEPGALEAGTNRIQKPFSVHVLTRHVRDELDR